MVDDLD